MRNAATMMLALAMGALAGCGGEDEAEPEVLTGTLQAGGAQGMQFSTPTQTGVIDATGAFKYQAGETITFSIGNVPLGTVPGAPEISLFRLAGLTPPTNELHLRRELNRTLTTVTALSRAINMARFLLALDVDGNPANGIDLRGRESTLTAANVDFDARVQLFPELLASAAPNLNNNISPARSTLQLYSWAGLKVRASYAVRQYRDVNADGVEDTLTSAIYGANGEFAASHFDRDLDGDRDGSIEYSQDALSRITRAVWSNDSGFGVIDTRSTATNDFDARGNLTLQTSLREGGLLPVYHHDHQSRYTYDDRGRPLTATFDAVDPFDSTVVSRSVVTYTRDARGNPTRVVTQAAATQFLQPAYRATEDNTFDSAGRMTSSTVSRDDGVDGQLDYRQTTVYGFGLDGRVATSVEERDVHADGTVDQRQRIRYSYDRAGNQERVQIEDELLVPGVTSSRSDTRSTFDGERRLLTRLASTDSDADGDTDESSEDLYTYDSNGMLTRVESVRRNVAANTTDYRSHFEASHSAEGAPLTDLYTLDFDGDGDEEIRESSRIEYEVSDDALPRILNNYLLSSSGGAVSAGF
jgi:hypothetical protein